MARYRKIKRRCSRSKKIMLLFIGISLLFVSGGYSILNSNVGFLGTLFVNKYKNMAVIQSFSSGDTTKFRSDTYRTKIETITLSESISPPEGYIDSWNLGVNGKSNVMGYITKRSDVDIYDLYIQGDGSLYANPNSTYLFGGLTGLKSINDLNILNTRDVTDMSYMFQNCSGLTSLDLSNFNTSNVTSMSYMFQSCSGLIDLDVGSFDTSKVTNMSSMFRYVNGLTSLNLSNFDTSNVTDMGYMFSYSHNLKSVVISNFNTGNVIDMSNMFYNCDGLTSLDLSNFDTSKVTNMSSMFYYCKGLASLDVSNFDTSKVTNMSNMFYYCKGLASLDVSGFDTSQVSNMGAMFSGCSGLTSLDVSKFDTSKVTNMYSMFAGTSKLVYIDLSNFDTKKVTRMSYMFNGCSSLISLDLSSFNTHNIKGIEAMFRNCNNLESLNISSFYISNVIDMHDVFNNCRKLTSLDLSNFDTSVTTKMYGMFEECSGLTSLDVSSFDTSKVTNMSFMFNNCKNLVTIYAGSKWSVASVTSSTNMFKDCTILKGAVAFDSTKIDVLMANYDTGYLTFKGNVYTVNMYDSNDTQNSQVFINKPISEGIVQYKTVSDARANFENRPMYLKHIIEGGNVKESYVEFVVTEEMATANEGMTAGTYALKGADATAYESNKSAMKTAFGESNCTGNSSIFNCSVSGLYADAYDYGGVYASDDDRACNVYDDGSSSCG